jgi:putative transposase
MFKSYKYRIYPDEYQQVMFAKTFGSCRKIYNWALDFKNKRYAQYKQNVSRYELSRMLTFLKTTDEMSYLKEVDSQALQQELSHLDIAFTNFFKHGAGYPKFKNKRGNQTFACTRSIKIDFKEQKVSVPKIKDVVVRIDREFEGVIKSCIVSKTTTDKYYIAILVDDGKELPMKKLIKEQTSIGIDVGLKSFLVDSNNVVVDNPKFYSKAEPRIKCLQRRLSKKVEGSNNRKKAQKKLALKHEKVANQRKDFLQKLSTEIIKNQDTIFIEDLDVERMLKSHNLAKSISDVSWSEFFRMLKYKSDWYGKNVIEIGRFEPSSKMCDCGAINNELKLEDRVWVCKECGSINERDFLAANNIKKFGMMKLKYNTYATSGTRGESVEMSTLVESVKQKLEQATVKGFAANAVKSMPLLAMENEELTEKLAMVSGFMAKHKIKIK